MAALSWLLIPVLAVLAATVWSSWASRRRTGIPDADGVAGYERFRAAMERSAEHPAEPSAERRSEQPEQSEHPVGIASRIVASAAAHRPLRASARRTPAAASAGSASSDGPAPAAD